MSNQFKSNSRFSALASTNEKSQILQTKRTETRELNKSNAFRSSSKKVVLNEENFPDLITQSPVLEKPINDNYINMVKKEVVKSDTNQEENLEPGWVIFKRENGKTISKCRISEKNEENSWAKEVVEALVTLHEERTNDFIVLNGYDNWEKIFKYPNWQEAETFFDQEDDEDEDNEDETSEEENEEFY